MFYRARFFWPDDEDNNEAEILLEEYFRHHADAIEFLANAKEIGNYQEYYNQEPCSEIKKLHVRNAVPIIYPKYRVYTPSFKGSLDFYLKKLHEGTLPVIVTISLIRPEDDQVTVTYDNKGQPIHFLGPNRQQLFDKIQITFQDLQDDDLVDDV